MGFAARFVRSNAFHFTKPRVVKWIRQGDVRPCEKCYNYFSHGLTSPCLLDFLKPIHEDAHLKNLRKIKKQGTEKFLSGKRYW